ncbi:RT0821/Lpp0805 family surface protein [Desulfogranum marinum]|jgi:surface antigen|uniref:RT0821/Lpp0805 family surface protein n=1 Tax=Desulfogranum marinum TaxID=453220 RepID=UPI001962D624|nr:RT0821/Lpp0805 family surface protein [Desulfogranum marinum]MBM9514470.1 glycine zipper 2TM domain-containing protein [Desulfogranum marinum]
MRHITVTAIVVLTLLSGCANLNKAQTGAVGGAAGGALIGQMIGHNTEATLIGAAVGTMLGYIVGNEMDKYDKQQLNHVYERGASNQQSSWINPDTGNQYAVTPQPAFKNPTTDQICRKAEISAIIDGKKQKTYTTACRDANGQWQLQ